MLVGAGILDTPVCTAGDKSGSELAALDWVEEHATILFRNQVPPQAAVIRLRHDKRTYAANERVFFAPLLCLTFANSLFQLWAGDLLRVCCNSRLLDTWCLAIMGITVLDLAWNTRRVDQ